MRLLERLGYVHMKKYREVVNERDGLAESLRSSALEGELLKKKISELAGRHEELSRDRDCLKAKLDEANERIERLLKEREALKEPRVLLEEIVMLKLRLDEKDKLLLERGEELRKVNERSLKLESELKEIYEKMKELADENERLRRENHRLRMYLSREYLKP